MYESRTQKKNHTQGNKKHFYDNNVWKRRVGMRAAYKKGISQSTNRDKEIDIEIKDDGGLGEPLQNIQIDENYRENRLQNTNNKARII